uniref:Phosphoserine phosphatase n=1 Tax=Clytia hemisphaerica TaxID=252671 RepID=A0A7M5UKB3_9CNID
MVQEKMADKIVNKADFSTRKRYKNQRKKTIKIEMATIPDNIKELWSNADAICFDVDSTVCTGEAIDDFATFLGIGDQVAELTRRAMGEGLSFRQSLDERLKLMKPSKEQLDGFIETQ